jgi:hypothetical protein
MRWADPEFDNHVGKIVCLRFASLGSAYLRFAPLPSDSLRLSCKVCPLCHVSVLNWFYEFHSNIRRMWKNCDQADACQSGQDFRGVVLVLSTVSASPSGSGLRDMSTSWARFLVSLNFQGVQFKIRFFVVCWFAENGQNANKCELNERWNESAICFKIQIFIFQMSGCFQNDNFGMRMRKDRSWMRN